MLLAIDTSTRTGSVAVVQDGAIRVHRTLDAGAQHGASLAIAVQGLGLDFDRLDAFAVTIGPGSFTGLRIALAFVKGLALVHPRPVLAISTLEVLAARLAEETLDGGALLLPLLDARRSEVYAALYRRGDAGSVEVDPRLGEGVYPLGTLIERVREASKGALVLAGGDGVRLDFGSALPWPSSASGVDLGALGPDAGMLARIADRRWSAGERGHEASELEPRYLMSAPGEPTAVPG